MKRILFLLVTVALTPVIMSVKSANTKQISLEATHKPSKAIVEKNVQVTVPVPKRAVEPVKQAPVVAPEPKTCAGEVAKYDWNKSVANAVMLAESGGDPTELNDTPATGDYSVGCFQVNIYKELARSRPSEAELKDPAVNVKWAYNHYVALGRTFGTTAGWGAFNSGAYLKYL